MKIKTFKKKYTNNVLMTLLKNKSKLCGFENCIIVKDGEVVIDENDEGIMEDIMLCRIPARIRRILKDF